MATPTFILFPGPTTWRLARWSRGHGDRFDVPAAGVAARLAELGNAGRPVALAIGSDACLAARVATADLPRNDGQALLYRFEEKLPLAAEAVAADFVPFDPPTDGALGVCALLDRVRPAVALLEDAGVAVQAIVPAMLAAAQTLLGDNTATAVLLVGDVTAAVPTVSAVAVRGGRPVDWAQLPATVADVKLHLAMLTPDLGDVPQLVAVGLPAALVDGLTEALSQAVTVRDGDPFDAAAAAAAAAVSGRRRPWVDLRRGPLAVTDRLRRHRRPLNAALAAVAAALAVTAAASFARSVRYDRAADAADARARADFRDRFPGWVMPTNVRAVVAAEHRRAASAGVGTPAAAGSSYGSSYGSSLATFRELLAGLPTTGRFAVERVHVGDDGFELSGRLASFDEAGAVAAGVAAAARRAGMTVPTPQTRREPAGTWTFVIQGSRPAQQTTADVR